MENVNKQLLDALIIARKMLDDEGYFPVKEIDLAIAAAEQAQQAEPVAWKPGKRPPSVFKTSEAGRQYVADFFANALQRHDFSSYIKGHLAADFACALSDGLHAMQTAQPPAVAGAVLDERAAFEAWLQENIDDTDTVRPSKEKVDAYFAVWLARAMLAAASEQPK